jgi:hypothetical protein
MTKECDLQEILRNENLIKIKQFSTGNSGAIVLHTTRDSTPMVIKIAINDRSAKELKDNKIGYSRIKQEQLEEVLPDILEIREKYIIMSYLGNSFIEQIKTVADKITMYSKLCENVFPLYIKSKKPALSTLFFNSLDTILNRNYSLLIANDFLPKESKELLFNSANEFSNLNLNCFSVFDFTPEDIYLTKTTIKYPDPNPIVRGIPIIDLACFAGVSRDVYILPESAKGYDILKKFSLTQVSELLNIKRNTAEAIFYYGRAIQSALSAKVRIQTDPTRSEKLAEKSIHYLNRTLSLLKK